MFHSNLSQAFIALIPSFVVVVFLVVRRSCVWSRDFKNDSKIFEPLVSIGDTPIAVILASIKPCTMGSRYSWRIIS